MATFSKQTQYEYCGINISVYIEVIALYHFSALQNSSMLSEPSNLSLHALFHSFLPNNIKYYSTTISPHRKYIIAFLNI